MVPHLTSTPPCYKELHLIGCYCCSAIGCFASNGAVVASQNHPRIASFYPSLSPLSELNLLFKDTTFEHPIIFITFKFRLSNELYAYII
jgi:hypothetical protein